MLPAFLESRFYGHYARVSKGMCFPQLLVPMQCALTLKVCRYAFGKGFPGLTPTFMDNPGAVYSSPAAIGTQQLSHKASAPRAAAVKSTRAAFLRQFVSHDQSLSLIHI